MFTKSNKIKIKNKRQLIEMKNNFGVIFFKLLVENISCKDCFAMCTLHTMTNRHNPFIITVKMNQKKLCTKVYFFAHIFSTGAEKNSREKK